MMMHSAHFDEVNVLGVPITCLPSYGDAVAYIVTRIRARTATFCVAINPLKLCLAWRNTAFMQLLCRADLYLCDGVGAAVAIRFLYRRTMFRVTGVQLFFDLIEAAEREGFRVFLFGASPESNEMAYRKLQDQYPALKLVGRHHGYSEDDDSVIDLINASESDMVFVAMGSPKQECWISEHRARLVAPFIMGVGGTFDVVSGNVEWAPAFFRRTGTEYIYRVYKQPQRLRQFPVLVKFLFVVLKESIGLRCSSRRSRVP
jgi:N-acetylglucosaminyldiphosphoundecaprenol N-acetyl-beta-D-mannosaminyltransferase